jgi:hypothetical protein
MATITAPLALIPHEHEQSKLHTTLEIKLEHASTALEIAVLM